MTTTNTQDLIAQEMALGLPSQPRCQWQELYFIGYAVVRYDTIMAQHELSSINWTEISNTLTREYYKVFLTQKLVSPDEAIHVGKSINKWTHAVIDHNGNKMAYAYRSIGILGHYQVSFVKFTKWKTNPLAALLRK